jgi:hypothetical protein
MQSDCDVGHNIAEREREMVAKRREGQRQARWEDDAATANSKGKGGSTETSVFPNCFFFQSQSQTMTLPPESTRVKIVTGVHFLPETRQKL